MNPYTQDILELLKRNFEKTVGIFPYKTVSEMQNYWLADYENNLIHPMNETVKKAYDQGAGSEISSGKIGALKSSSALTYNLFWNQTANIVRAKHNIGNGFYTIELEKQLKTLKNSNAPAHLDAFLYCKDNVEGVACEMKMTEWIFSKPGTLKISYLNPENYIDLNAGLVFVGTAKTFAGKPIMRKDGTCVECESVFLTYDAFQMFKHAVSLYRSCYENHSGIPREMKKLTLLNCVWNLSSPDTLEKEAFRKKYDETWRKEVDEFNCFSTKMKPIKDLFMSDFGITFDIRLCTFTELLGMLEKTPEELSYLGRYII